MARPILQYKIIASEIEVALALLAAVLLSAALHTYAKPVEGSSQPACSRLVHVTVSNNSVLLTASPNHCLIIESIRLDNLTISTPPPRPCLRSARIGGPGSLVPIYDLDSGDTITIDLTVQEGSSRFSCKTTLTIRLEGNHENSGASHPGSNDRIAGPRESEGSEPTPAKPASSEDAGRGLNSLAPERPVRVDGESETPRVSARVLIALMLASWAASGVSALCGVSRRR